MESLGYVLLYLLRGTLPWQGLKAANKKQKYDKIRDKKLEVRAASKPGDNSHSHSHSYSHSRSHTSSHSARPFNHFSAYPFKHYSTPPHSESSRRVLIGSVYFVVVCATQVLVEELCRGFPEEFVKYVTYTRSLRFDEKPDYDYMRMLFRDLFVREVCAALQGMLCVCISGFLYIYYII